MKEERPSAQTTIEHKLESVDGFGDKKAVLVFLSGSMVGRKVPLITRETSVGRSSKCSISINDRHISRTHFVVLVDERGALLKDEKSKNGTMVNGVKLRRHRLRDGDKIQLSNDTILKFTLQDVAESEFHDQMYNMAVMDPVTNIYNRRHFLQRLSEAFERAVTEDRNLALLMLDLDHFKQVNDTFGHLAGDEVLITVARELKRMLRSSDTIARFGGEEFAVLLDDKDEELACQIAERMRSHVEKLPVPYDDHVIHITMSIGVTVHNASDPFESPQELIREADNCLYMSKEQGRNRTTSSSQALAETRTLL